MQRLNRSTHAPLGTAFFLFLGLAIVPVSLKAAGVQVGFSPRLSAAVEAWQQIAEVFGASYRPGSQSEAYALNNPGNDLIDTTDEESCTRRELACSRGVEHLPEAPQPVSEPRLSRVLSRAECPKTKVRRSHAEQLKADITVAAIHTILKEPAPVLDMLGDVELDTKTREALLRSIDGQLIPYGFDPRGIVKELQIPENVKMMIRVKPALLRSAARATECKVRSTSYENRSYERTRMVFQKLPVVPQSPVPESSEL